MSSNITYYAQIIDTATDKIFNIDTSLPDQQSSLFSLSLNDDVYTIHPYGVFMVKDTSGVFFSKSPFAEGHKYRITLGYIDESQGFKINRFLTSEFYWSRNEISIAEKSDIIAGHTLHHFASFYHLKDGISLNSIKSKVKRVYSNKTASEVVRDIVSSDFIKEDKYILISKSKSTRTWYLTDYTSLEFIENVLRKYAISVSNDSPFFAFFNLKNEFHFRSAYDLINNKPLPPPDFYTNDPAPSISYVLNFSNPTYASDTTSILNYNFIYIGTEEYQRLINLRNYTIDSKTGKYVKLNSNLADQIYSTSGKLPIKSPNYFKDKRENNIKDIKYRGLFKEDVFLKATVYQDYIDAVFSIRMQIVVLFNPEAVSGRTIELTCYDSDSNINSIFSGTWVILKSEHRYEIQEKLGNRMITTSLEIGKNSFDYELDGGFYYDKSLKTISTNLLA